MTGREELAYQLWLRQNNVPQSDDYDMQGFYRGLLNMDPRAMSSVNPNDAQMHYPDTWKLPNHQSFSTESQYYDPATMPNTPSWTGGPIGKTKGESWSLRRPDGTVVQSEAPWLR